MRLESVSEVTEGSENNKRMRMCVKQDESDCKSLTAFEASLGSLALFLEEW